MNGCNITLTMAVAMGLIVTPACAQDRLNRNNLSALTEGAFTMEADADYASRLRRPDYVALPERRGFFANGLLGDAANHNEYPYSDECEYLIVDADVPVSQYWYFMSGRDGLVLSQYRVIESVENCRAKIRVEVGISRLIVDVNGFTRASRNADGSYNITTARLSELLSDETDDLRMGSGFDIVTWLAVRKRNLEAGRLGQRIGNARTRCDHHNSPPDAGVAQCWVTDGAAAGLVTYDMRMLMAQPEASQIVRELRNTIFLDSRLFEWDRAISMSEALPTL